MQKLLRTLIVLVLIYITMFIGKTFSKTEFFNIKDIKINGKSELLNADILDKIEQLKGKNLLYLNTSKIEKNLNEDARIDKIIIKKTYPSKLTINLQEKEIKYYLKKGGNIFLVNEKLDIFGYIFEIKEKDIPVVILDEENKDIKEDLKIIISKISNQEIYSIVSEIKKVDKEYELILNNGVVIITDPLVSEDKYDKVFKLYEKIKDKKPIIYMDIRFNDVVVKHN